MPRFSEHETWRLQGVVDREFQFHAIARGPEYKEQTSYCKFSAWNTAVQEWGRKDENKSVNDVN